MNKCRRKYFYRYKLGIPEEASLEMLLGSLVHEAIKQKSDGAKQPIGEIFDSLWEARKAELKKLAGSEFNQLHQEYRKMALKWQKDFNPQARYQCEVPLKSEKYQAFGVLDEISELDGKVRVLDDKASKRCVINKDHETQLAIYALLYLENFGKLPDHLGIRFLRTGEKQYLPVNDKLISKAIYECKMMRVKNLSDHIVEYPRNPSPLCNWGKGKCSYLERCFP